MLWPIGEICAIVIVLFIIGAMTHSFDNPAYANHYLVVWGDSWIVVWYVAQLESSTRRKQWHTKLDALTLARQNIEERCQPDTDTIFLDDLDEEFIEETIYP